MRVLAVLALGIAFVGGIIGGLSLRPSSAESQSVRDIQVKVVAPIVGANQRPDGTTCFGSGASTFNDQPLDLSDFDVKPQVVIRDDQSIIVAKAELSDGIVSNDTGLFSWDYPMNRIACVWTFSVNDLPERPFYEIAIGRQTPRVLSNIELKSRENPIIDFSFDAR